MRMRRKKHGAERIAACAELLIQLPQTETPAPVMPALYFPAARQNMPVWLEIGCGKGGFATGMAAAHPQANFLAMERVADVACLALEKAKACAAQRPEDNLRFIIANAERLDEFFAPASFTDLFLNFSDPWPKKGYAKRRLTHRNFLEQYKKLLVPGGYLHFKTDNDDLFAFSIEEFAAFGLTLVWKTDDLHNSAYNEGNVETEYEHNFASKGKNIHAALLRFEDGAAQ